MTVPTGRTLGRFVVEHEIGRGGMGEVWLARQETLERPAVLKKLRRDLAEQDELRARFQREARAAAAVHHQNVVAVYDCFSHRGDQFIAQEYVDGVDLRSALARTGALPWRIAALIALATVRGLEAIHGHGTVHRDLKPPNILLGRRGEVKIADFGIALEASASALTRPGVLIGSPPYMPPEQLLGERLDARGDLFSLGVVLYEMLTGEVPYPEPEDDASETWLTRMQKERYVRPRRRVRGLPRYLDRLVRRCLRARPRQRVATAAAVRRELERRLGMPSPADLQSELARYLWDAQVFETRANETVVMVAAPAEPAPRRGGWVPATLAGVLLCATVLVVDVRPARAPSEAPASPGTTAPGDEPPSTTTDADPDADADADAVPADPASDLEETDAESEGAR